MSNIYEASIFLPGQGIYAKKFLDILSYFVFCYNQMLTNYEKIESSNEEYIRDVYIEEYVKQYQQSYGLINISFSTENRVIKNREVIGRDDIRAVIIVGGIPIYKNLYYIIECKRLKNFGKNDAYIKEGLIRFVNNVYSEDKPLGGMIGFREKGKKDNLSIVEDINSRMLKNVQTKTVVHLTKFNISSDFHFSYFSRHERIDNNDPIELYHLFLDMESILV